MKKWETADTVFVVLIVFILGVADFGFYQVATSSFPLPVKEDKTGSVNDVEVRLQKEINELTRSHTRLLDTMAKNMVIDTDAILDLQRRVTELEKKQEK